MGDGSATRWHPCAEVRSHAGLGGTKQQLSRVERRYRPEEIVRQVWRAFARVGEANGFGGIVMSDEPFGELLPQQGVDGRDQELAVDRHLNSYLPGPAMVLNQKAEDFVSRGCHHKSSRREGSRSTA